jgi:hypothetical protein
MNRKKEKKSSQKSCSTSVSLRLKELSPKKKVLNETFFAQNFGLCRWSFRLLAQMDIL